jgi:DNA polymerase-3 subunit alpha
MAKMKESFIAGAVEVSGADSYMMEKFWKQLEDFAAYCFNKSHAACYAMIAYQTAYLKAHYPAAFMAALMTSDYDDIERLAIEISECTAMGMTVLPPDVNESFLEFAVVPNEQKVRFGMNAIKNVGAGAVEEIIRARDAHGQFKSLEDFFSKVNPRIVNRKAVESLIRAGAFDAFEDRGNLLHNIDTLLAFASKKQKELDSGQTDLFGEVVEAAQDFGPQLVLTKGGGSYNLHDYLQWERELLGIYLSQHPLETFKHLFEEQAMKVSELTPEMDTKRVTLGGIVESSRTITTKNGQAMAFVRLTTLDGEIELILFPSIFQQTIDMWTADTVLLIKGKLNAKDREGNMTTDLKVLVDEARPVTLEQAKAYQTTGKKLAAPKGKSAKARIAAATAPVTKNTTEERIYIRLLSTDDKNALLALKSVVDAAPAGSGEVVLIVGKDSSKQAIRLPQKVAITTELTASLVEIFGQANVK